jgi:hypothetical protein
MENQSAFADTMNAEITAWLNDIEVSRCLAYAFFILTLFQARGLT